MPLKSSKQVFEADSASGVPRTSKGRNLKRLAFVYKAAIRPPLTNTYKKKQLQWAQEYMKINFQTALFTGEWMVPMFQQGCDVSKEVVESCFGPESWELVDPSGVKWVPQSRHRS